MQRYNKNGGKMKRKIVWQCTLKSAREKCGLTIRQVERATGVSNASISQIERGGNPSLDTATSLAKYFGLLIEEMWPRRIK